MDITKPCRDIDELLSVARKACNLFLVECKKAGLNIFITETYRPQARQNYLYEQGRTRPGNKVTWTKSSRHTSRLAWDIAVNPPKDLYDAATLKKAGAIAKKLGITWGGTWTTPDMPHFEVTKDWQAPNVKAPVKTTNVSDKYKVKKSIAGYVNAADAKSRKNKKTTVKAGAYHIFNKSAGMINVTSKKGVPGSWINPADNK